MPPKIISQIITYVAPTLGNTQVRATGMAITASGGRRDLGQWNRDLGISDDPLKIGTE